MCYSQLVVNSISSLAVTELWKIVQIFDLIRVADDLHGVELYL
jgi:hypothetical protein